MIDFEELRGFYRGRKVLITGHTGFKGSYLSAILSVFGARVYGYALKPETERSLFEILYGRGMASRTETELLPVLPEGSAVSRDISPIEESHIGDILDFEELQSFYDRIEPEIVIHMAAQPIVRMGYREPKKTYETNVTGTVNILECVRMNPCCKAFLNVTTDKVYANEEKPGSIPHAFSEDEKLDGEDPYANSKSCSEIITHCYAKSFLKAAGVGVSTARAGNSIGGGDFSTDRIMADAARAAIGGGILKLRNPLSIRPYQHVFEPLFVYLLILKKSTDDPSYASWYNVGPDASMCITTGELADMFRKAFGGGFEIERTEEPLAPREAGLLLLDSQKARDTFGFESIWDIRDAAEAAADWTKAFMKGPSEANLCLFGQLKTYMEGKKLS